MSKIQEFTCTVCGKIVTRRKSYAFKNGRACKEHNEVSESLLVRNEIEIAKQRSKDIRQGDRIGDRIVKAKKISDWGKTHCWICKSDGLEGSKFWEILLDTFGTGLVSNVEDLFKHEKIAGKKILIQFPHMGTKIFNKLDMRMIRDATMTGHAVICPTCAEDHNLDPEFLISAMANVDTDILESVERSVIDKIEELI